MLSAIAVPGLPEIAPGDDLAELIARALQHDSRPPQGGDVLVVAHKVVSKAEGRVRRLSDVTPASRAAQLAARHGFVCANAGVDASNVPGEDSVVLLPVDPDGSARGLRKRLRELTGVAPAIVITDSFGRAWRHGQTDVAIGCAGLRPLEDWRGLPDAVGREMRATWIAVADELAGAGDLARAKDGSQPVVLLRGAHRHVSAEDGPGAAALIRPEEQDLFR